MWIMKGEIFMKILDEFKNQYKEVLKKIKEYDIILVFRHEFPDFDASGTQNGLVTWLKDSFPLKKIYSMGNDFIDFTPRLFPHIEEVNVDELGDFLAIVVDTGNTARIDNKAFQKAKEIIKFDHHPAVENYGLINIVKDELASCAELIVDFIASNEKKYPMSPLCAKYLFTGMVGDSGRFLFPSTSIHTFESATYCIEKGINISKDVYQIMYEKTLMDLEIQKYLLNNYKISQHGVAYYVFNKEELEQFNIRVDQAKIHMSIFSNIKGIEIWVSVSEDVNRNEYRVSIRSKNIPINKIAEKYRGGGHENASGAKLASLYELDNLINDLDELIK